MHGLPLRYWERKRILSIQKIIIKNNNAPDSMGLCLINP